MTAALRAEGVSKRYGETVALDDVSLSVDAGEIFALLGPNGAGKSTLVRTLTGTTTADAGSVTVLGETPADVDGERVGHLPQSFRPPERLTARELLSYYAGLYERPRDVDEVLSAVGLADDADTWYANLSGGQQRRVCVGIALINDPDLLFLDEPTTGIDPAGRQALWSLVRELAADGTTVFLTTHYMKEAEELADTVALLDDGELVETGSPSALVRTHGGRSHLFVETTAPPADVGRFDFDAERVDGGLCVRGVLPVDIGDVIGSLDARGVEYDAVTWAEPTLEDVYLRLTDERVVADSTADRPLASAGGSR